MAQENVAKLVELIRSDEALQAKLKEAFEAYDGPKDDERAVFEATIAPIAAEAGLPCTYEEGLGFATADRNLSDEELLRWLEERVKLVRFTHDCRLPITIRYATPETLGSDRIANAVGAHALCPDNNVLSIMAGTCLVADFVSPDGSYWGGRIAPGMRMRFQAS